MNFARAYRFSTLICVLAWFGACASAADFSFSGAFLADDNSVVITFTVSSTSTVDAHTWSYGGTGNAPGGTNIKGQVIPPGGFVPVLSLFDATGNLIALSSAGPIPVPPFSVDPTTGAAFDGVFIPAPVLTPGTYTLVLTEYDNLPNGPTLADGFSEQGNGNFTGPLFGCPDPNVPFCDLSAVNRTANWQLDLLNVASASLASSTATMAFQVGYAANLNIGDSVVNLSNGGAQGGVFGAGTTGNICVNVYTFDPQEEEIGCCSCLVTPNGLNSLSAKNSLISNTLTPSIPASVLIKLVASQPGTDVTGNFVLCNPASVGPFAATAPYTVPLVTPAAPLAAGMLAWGATLAPSSTPGTYKPVPVHFLNGSLSASELTGLTSLCNFIRTNGSGYGICKGCQVGALRGAKQ